MIRKEQIAQLVEQKIAGTDLFLVDVTVSTSNKISISIDKFSGGVAINDCVELSRYVDSSLNRDEEDFSLEVSSAGVDNPFQVHQQYLKNIGRKVEVVHNDGTKFEGTLARVSDTEIELELQTKDKKTKKETTELLTFPFLQIKATKKIISFK